MPRVQIVVIRHSISCSNYLRLAAGPAASGPNEDCNPIIDQSKDYLDPPLSTKGVKMARGYSTRLQERLRAAGINLETALIGASELRRAQQTAQLLFPAATVAKVPHFTEHGEIPENTPAAGLRHEPDWRGTLQYLASTGKSQMVIVGHGSYLRYTVWPSVSRAPSTYMGNIDAILIDAILTPSGLLLKPRARRINYDGPYNPNTARGDSCVLPHKLAHLTKMIRRRSAKTKKQRGGATSMPLSWYDPSAAFRGTSSTPTGVGAAGSSDTWARAPLPQRGGLYPSPQRGGFHPSVMGAFATNGLRMLPVAAYMGYKQSRSQKNRQTQRRVRRSRNNRARS
jgi:phosphohistidine phosphatase SixA